MEWTKVSDKLPEEFKPVFLTREITENISNADIGYYITNETGDEGWHIGNELFLKMHARNYWIYLEETEISVPSMRNDEDLEIVLKYYMHRLIFFEKKFIQLAKCMMQSGQGAYQLDFYISGILNRSLSLIYGFQTLIESANFISAAHLVRPHLDNYLRLYASWLVNNPHDFVVKVLEGERVGKIKDKDDQFMSDAYLVKKAAIEYPWITKVYQETSGFVHFSNKHIFNATSVSKTDENTLSTFIGKTDNQVSNESKIEAVIAMIEISNCLAKQIFGWVDTKRIEG